MTPLTTIFTTKLYIEMNPSSPLDHILVGYFTSDIVRLMLPCCENLKTGSTSFRRRHIYVAERKWGIRVEKKGRAGWLNLSTGHCGWSSFLQSWLQKVSKTTTSHCQVACLNADQMNKGFKLRRSGTCSLPSWLTICEHTELEIADLGSLQVLLEGLYRRHSSVHL